MDQEMEDEDRIQPLFTVEFDPELDAEQQDIIKIQVPTDTQNMAPIVITPMDTALKDEDSTAHARSSINQVSVHASEDVESSHPTHDEAVKHEFKEEYQKLSTPVGDFNGTNADSKDSISGDICYIKNCSRKVFVNLDDYKVHCHHFHQCTVCASIFQSIIDSSSSVLFNDLNDFLSSHHHDSGFYPCPLCSDGYTTMDKLLRHVQRLHAQLSTMDGMGRKSDKCYLSSTCSRETFVQLHDYVDHCNEFHEEKIKKCIDCYLIYHPIIDGDSEKILVNATLHRHHHKTPIYPCPFCPENKMSKTDLDKHVTTIHTVKKEDRNNGGCYFTACSITMFVQLHDYMDHCKKFHENIFKKCKDCINIYQPMIDNPKTGLVSVPSIKSHCHETALYPCPYCPKGKTSIFSQAMFLYGHIKTVHTVPGSAPGLYRCRMCPKISPKKFCTESYLERHMEQVHSVKIICPKTDKKDPDTGVPYEPCDFVDNTVRMDQNTKGCYLKDCSKETFVKLQDYWAHRKEYHNKGEFQKCHECIQLYQPIIDNPSALTKDYSRYICFHRHETGGYVCPVCPSMFTQHVSLLNHVREFHIKRKATQASNNQRLIANAITPHSVTQAQKSRTSGIKNCSPKPQQTKFNNQSLLPNTGKPGYAQMPDVCNIQNCSGKAFPSHRAYIEHCKKFHQEVFKQCARCTDIYLAIISNSTKPTSVYVHQHETELYPCPFCIYESKKSKVFYGATYLYEHVLKNHATIRPILPKRKLPTERESVPERISPPKKKSPPEREFLPEMEFPPERKLPPERETAPERKPPSEKESPPKGKPPPMTEFPTERESIPERKSLPEREPPPERKSLPEREFPLLMCPGGCKPDSFNSTSINQWMSHCEVYHKELLNCRTCLKIFQQQANHPWLGVHPEYKSHYHTPGIYVCPICQVENRLTIFKKLADITWHVNEEHVRVRLDIQTSPETPVTHAGGGESNDTAIKVTLLPQEGTCREAILTNQNQSHSQ